MLSQLSAALLLKVDLESDLIDLLNQIAFKELYRSDLYPNDAKPLIGLLDINSGFGNTNHLQPNVLWTPENDLLEKHRDMVKQQFMWHANHTIGVKNKIDMLDRFKVICENTSVNQGKP